MALMTEQQFEQFFTPYAENVEGFYEARYWSLSDELIKELIRRHLDVEPGDRVLDAGGGTGRFALWLAGELGVRVTVADKSETMLAQAERNLANAGSTSVDLVLADLHDAPELPTDGFDAIISTYGVLSFLEDPEQVFRTLARVLKPGGVGLLMSHSLSTALTSKLSDGTTTAQEIRNLYQKRVVQWSPSVPPLRVYTAQELTDLAHTAGLEVHRTFGVTCVAHPGPEDFGYPYTGESKISRSLQDPEFFQAALETELSASADPAWSERGINLLIKVSKPAGG
ncbi:methyltransferase domain-containing protein [Plantactinospora sp. S1510]|uniref:Methyltransferase domain-containing protein n=1 Tax=Plantactinospora alkalitolerans TaxID=2789879 RepID=A0ABS0H174_9ACTN|nr:class I SAM-dependent methyltransferase [Plantactinospora alkalitolerans]MBF9132213.1 methyltransferase domain-containing protein [Plantactinospora alkalitolerans]